MNVAFQLGVVKRLDSYYLYPWCVREIGVRMPLIKLVFFVNALDMRETCMFIKTSLISCSVIFLLRFLSDLAGKACQCLK